MQGSEGTDFLTGWAAAQSHESAPTSGPLATPRLWTRAGRTSDSAAASGNAYRFTKPSVFGICLSYACPMTMSALSGISFGSLSYPSHVLATTRLKKDMLVIS